MRTFTIPDSQTGFSFVVYNTAGRECVVTAHGVSQRGSDPLLRRERRVHAAQRRRERRDAPN